MDSPIPTRIVRSVHPSRGDAGQVKREFLGRMANGARIRPAGRARRNPQRLLLSAGYTPKHGLRLFDATFYLTNVRQNDDIRFFVAYVVLERVFGVGKEIYPRIFYKDISLIWRSASHYIRSHDENWIGKGDLRVLVENGVEYEVSAESTTDLPLEMQTALETLSRGHARVRHDAAAIALVLRRAPDDRLEAYRDFREPRRRARANPRNLVNGGRSIARFTRRNDPTSLRFAAGFEPDFGRGILEVTASRSKLYGGRLRRFRILSVNRRIQYLFMAGPRHVWIIPPQTTTTELSSYGVRTVDVLADDDLFVPGFEYHFGEGHEDPSALFNQIPEGFAGEANEHDASRADTSAWLDRLPVVREFRRRVLGASPPGRSPRA